MEGRVGRGDGVDGALPARRQRLGGVRAPLYRIRDRGRSRRLTRPVPDAAFWQKGKVEDRPSRLSDGSPRRRGDRVGGRSSPGTVFAPRVCPRDACARCGARPAAPPNGVRSDKPADSAGLGSGAPSRTNSGQVAPTGPPRSQETAAEREGHEQDGAHREDSGGSRRDRKRSPGALRGLRAGGHGGAQGRRGGQDNGLREVLRQGAQGQGGPQPPDRREDEDRGVQGALVQRGQRPQRGRLGAAERGPDVLTLLRKGAPLTGASVQALCQVRSKTESPCPNLAVAEIRGVAFCGPCAREQEAYFAIGELVAWEEEAPGPRGTPLAQALERVRRERGGGRGGVAAAVHRGRSDVYETQ